MCGIVGALEYGVCPEAWEGRLRAMTESLAHRGPDDEGWWFDSEAGVGLGHRRLSVLDLSALGHQPMVSSSGRYRLTYNGEVYNYPALRRELEDQGHGFRGQSDTEVVLCAFEQWGVREAVRRFVGMFAFAVWDEHERLLVLGRDRAGEKPLYFGWQGNAFLFGSELKALRLHPQWCAEIDRGALALFLRHSQVPAPYSIYRGISKLLPGTLLSIPDSAASLGVCPDPLPYWSLRQVAESGMVSPYAGGRGDAVAELDRLLQQATSDQMIADVPVGAFLSGGIDSSTVVALMQAQSEQSIRTFTIGFEEDAFDEARHARAVADHLDTEHTELYLNAAEATEIVADLPTIYDEPFADSSQIPTTLLSRLTRRHVTVSLSGDGGDELFGGYARYHLARRLWNAVAWVPQTGRVALSAIPALSATLVEGLFQSKTPGQGGRSATVGDRLRAASEILTMESPEMLFRRLVSHWKAPAIVVLGLEDEPQTLLTDRRQWPNLPELSLRMMYLDTITYLPDDLLVKVDRASMAVGLESRAPFLDHRLIEFVWSLPPSLRVDTVESKGLLRQLLDRYVPRSLTARPKSGFSVPIASWLRGPLRQWAEDLLTETRLRRQGYFDPSPIRQKWLEHATGKRDWHYYLWDVLTFQAWLDTWSR